MVCNLPSKGRSPSIGFSAKIGVNCKIMWLTTMCLFTATEAFGQLSQTWVSTVKSCDRPPRVFSLQPKPLGSCHKDGTHNTKSCDPSPCIFYRNRGLWAVVTKLALLIFVEVIYYHMNIGFTQKSHKPDRTRLYFKVGATYRLPWYTLGLSGLGPHQCFLCKILFNSESQFCKILFNS